MWQQDPLRAKFIDDIIQFYWKRRGPEAKDVWKRKMHMQRNNLKNPFASVDMKDSSASEFRKILDMPVDLGKQLELLDNPPFLGEVAEVRWFLKKYPEFKVSEKSNI